MQQSVGAVALDIVMGKNTVTGVVKSAMSECQKVISDSSASMGTKVTAVGNAMQGVGKAIMPVSGAAIAAGVAVGKMATDFEEAMAKVNTIADTTEVPLSDLQKQIMELSNKSGISASEIADNVYNAISAGQKTGDAVNFVANSTKLAKAGFADAGASLDVLTTILNSYGMEAKEVTKVSDILIQTQNKGKTTVGELSAYMGKVIPTANAYGVNLENVATNYAIMTAKGIATAESTTYMNSMFNELGKSSTGVAKELKSLTGKSFKELMESGMSVGDVLMVLKDNCDKTGTQFTDLWGSAEAGKAALVLTQEGAAGFNNMLAGMQNSAGSTDAAFGKMETKGYTLQKAMNTLKNTGIELGTALMQTLGPMIEGLSEKVAAFSAWFGSLDDGTKKIIVKIGMFVAAAGPLLIIGGKIAAGAGSIINLCGKVGSGIGGVVSKIGGFGKAASTAAAPVKAASTATGALSKNALGLIAAGAGILLAAAGLALLAKSAVALAAAGWPAIAVMGGLMVALAAMAVGAAALAPALTAGAVGLVAFGAAVALVGVGILAMCSGFATLAGQLPTIAEYGLTAAASTVALAGAIGLLSAALAFLTVTAATSTATCGLLSIGLVALTGASLLNGVQLAAHTLVVGLFTVALGAAAIACGALGAAVAVLTGNVSAGCGNIAGTITGTLGNAFNWLKSIPAQAVGWGKDMIQGLINGIKSMIGAVGNAVGSIAKKITSFLHFSVPDEGPLTEYESWMPDFMQGMAKGITDNQYLVTDAVKGVAGEMKVTPTLTPPQLKNTARTQNNGSREESGDGDTRELLKTIIELLKGDRELTASIFLGADLLDEQTVKASRMRALRSGGRA